MRGTEMEMTIASVLWEVLFIIPIALAVWEAVKGER